MSIGFRGDFFKIVKKYYMTPFHPEVASEQAKGIKAQGSGDEHYRSYYQTELEVLHGVDV